MPRLAKVLVLPVRKRRASAAASPSGPQDPAPRERRARRATLALLALTLGVPAIGKLVSLREDTRAVGRLAPSERALLYRHAIEEVEAACLQPGADQGTLRRHCVEQAQFVLLFPECDDTCRRAATAMLPHARR